MPGAPQQVNGQRIISKQGQQPGAPYKGTGRREDTQARQHWRLEIAGLTLLQNRTLMHTVYLAPFLTLADFPHVFRQRNFPGRWRRHGQAQWGPVHLCTYFCLCLSLSLTHTPLPPSLSDQASSPLRLPHKK